MPKNANEFILKEGVVQYGTWTSPHLIAPGVDPSSSFTSIDDVGYIRQGTIVVGLNDSFVEYLSNTPHEIVRKDLLRRNITMAFTLNQFNANNYGLFQRLDTESGLYILAHMGLDVPVETRYGYLFTGEKVDGTVIKIAIYSGGIVTEDKSLTFQGTDYVNMPVMIQAFKHPSFVANPNDKRCYGLFYELAAS